MRNKYCHYISSRITRYTRQCITKSLLLLYIYIYSYIMINKYSHYTSSRIMRNTFSYIREINILIIHRLI